MLCQKCGINAAEVHFVQTLNGERTEVMLCGKCAAEKGLGVQISFNDFLHSFIGATAAAYQEAEIGGACNKCGLTLGEMQRNGKAGCSECYTVFKPQIDRVIKNVQAGIIHKGRYPKRAVHISVDREIADLKQKLNAAIAQEQYEEAASIRDAIRSLKGEGNETV